MKLIELNLKSISFFLALFFLIPMEAFSAPGRNWVLNSNTDSIVLGQAAPLSALGAPGRNWVLDYRYDSVTCNNCSGGGGVTSVTASLPLLSSGGTTPNISLPQSSSSQDGYLSQGDWSLFNAKQPAGNYITGLTGDVSAAGPGSVAATLANKPNTVFVDFTNGSDSTGTGSLLKPWKTLQHTYNSITPSINTPFTIFLTGGNNDTDSSPITGKGNVSIIADYPIQVQAITISQVSNTNDIVNFTNLIFLGALTWIRNDFNVLGVGLNNVSFFNGPILKQTGVGSISLTCINCVTVNADFLTGPTGSFFFNTTFLGATTTFEDANSSAYYELMGGYNSSNIQISGGASLYLSGLQCDEPFGCALTGITTSNGTPLIQSDDSSVPASIAGAFSFNFISHSQWLNYTAGTPGDWAGSAPTNVKAALDRMAALLKTLNGGSPIP